MRTITRALVLALAAAAPRAAVTQSALDRSPNLSGGWLGEPGTLQFNFVHRFQVSKPPQRQVTNYPTFVLAYRLPAPLLVGVTYATRSDVGGTFPNEWEVFGRLGVLRDSTAPVQVAVQAGYNQAARSVDAEVTLGRRVGPVRLVGVGRVLSNGFGRDTTRYAIGGGATLRLHRWIALAGDVASLYARRPGEAVAWGAALQLAIPYSPHTLSLQVTNTTTGTLQGASRGGGKVRGGFEFTIPFTLSRYFRRSHPGAGGAGAAVPANATRAEMRQMAFAPDHIEITAGTTLVWTNQDQLVHTVTADDSSWTSGDVAPGASWSRSFATPGTYAFHCTPHPFMKGVIIVR